MSTALFNLDISRLMDNLSPEQKQTLDVYADHVQAFIDTVVERGGAPAQWVKNMLNGTWLGHALHPALTDIPIGAWFTGALLDAIGADRAADAAYSLGVLGAIPTVLAGAADWDNLSDEPRRVGLIHAVLNAIGTGLIVGSLLARRSNRRGLGVLLSTAGLTCTSVAAWLGGHLVYALGTGVSRTAFEPPVEQFAMVAPAESVHSNTLVRGEVDVNGVKVPLVLFNDGQSIRAISATCTHAGGNLADGAIVDDDGVECPLHGSRFSLIDGGVRRGPASVPAPVFEVRVRDGTIEVRHRA